MASNLITLENISKAFSERALFSDVSLGINENDRIGVIGINGTGKSTFLKIIAGLTEPDSGNIAMRNGLRIAYLPQTPFFEPGLTLLQNVVKGVTVKESYRNIEGEAASMLSKVGLNDPNVDPSTLSGGQRKRAALIKTLLCQADLLVLDEPTNHLDLEMTSWLENVLAKHNGAFIMITHDRYFLDRVSNKIVEIDKGHLYTYQTNYSGFLELKAEREEMAISSEQKAKNLYRIELAWMNRGARARSTKQKAHIQRFEDLKNREKPTTDGQVEINALSSRLGKKTIEVHDISKSFENKILFNNFSYIFLPTDRVGIIGKNGCGKSSLLNILTGRLSPDHGIVEIGQTVKIGYFSQENESLDESKTVLELVRDTAEYINTTEGQLSASVMCSKFLFDKTRQYTKIEKLSGGEKRRLYLLKVLMDAPNILILDEPTNDLDTYTLTVLEDFLSTYPGILITVSHDRYFLDKTVSRIFAFERNSLVQYEGNYSDYEACVKNRSISESSLPEHPSVSNKNTPSKKEGSNKKLKFSYNEQLEFDHIDSEIEELEKTISELEKEIEENSSNYGKLTELTDRLEKKHTELDAKMERWVYLNDLAEEIKRNKSL